MQFHPRGLQQPTFVFIASIFYTALRAYTDTALKTHTCQHLYYIHLHSPDMQRYLPELPVLR